METLEAQLKAAMPAAVEFCSMRYVRSRDEALSVRQNVVQPVSMAEDGGVMVTIVDGGGMGYAGTSDLSAAGIRAAVEKAREWAKRSAGKSVVDYRRLPRTAPPTGHYQSPVRQAWDAVSVKDKLEWLRAECEALKIADAIVDWEASLWHTAVESLYLTSDGGRIEQRFSFIVPDLSATANRGTETISRSFGARGYCRQGGLEVLDRVGFRGAATTVAREALQLLDAPNCPTGTMDVLLAPDQMILQIHESIGHPLELDRILGDERNYAGTSFVTPEMFGTYRYGSDLLDVTFDPSIPEEFASYGYDDEGIGAEKTFLIHHGILLRGLGSATSQARSGIAGVANSRATNWNRQPIDRMANLNLEPGTSSLAEMIRSVERGIYMKTNCSWSIDDSRNKFQFGCEWGQLIENGELTTVVKKPNYRGISATFWRALKAVGDQSTFEVLGTPFCGKGEPNQIIRVGHATPACLFSAVDVFGGAT